MLSQCFLFQRLMRISLFMTLVYDISHFMHLINAIFCQEEELICTGVCNPTSGDREHSISLVSYNATVIGNCTNFLKLTREDD